MLRFFAEKKAILKSSQTELKHLQAQQNSLGFPIKAEQQETEQC